MATPTVKLNHDKAPLGSPLDITYRFVVAPDAHFDQDYVAFVHVLDVDNELMWNDDHVPPVPPSQWKPGQVVEYTRTIFVPIYPYVGEATVQLGLYSPKTQKRIPLAGEDAGQRGYKVGRLTLQPQTENIFTSFESGWNTPEVADRSALIQWQWTKKDATLKFRNPKRDGVFYLEADSARAVFQEPQQVRITIGDARLDAFPLPGTQRVFKKIPFNASQLGTGDLTELHITVDKTFIPNVLDPKSADTRELGIRVYHAFVDAR